MISIDTETNWTDSEANRYPIGLSIFTDLGDSFYIPVAHTPYLEGLGVDPFNARLPYRFLEPCRGKVIVFHNAKFDLNQLQKLVDIEPLYDSELYCTMVMGNIINENLGVGLDVMGQHYLGIGKRKDLSSQFKKDEWHKIPPHIMAVYAERDTELTLKLYQALVPHFDDYTDYWKRERQFLFLLQRMETRGLPVDLEFCREQSEACTAKMEAVKEQLGFDPAKPSQLHERLFSPPPLGLDLKPSSYTPTGKPQVNDNYLAELQHPIAGLIQEYRGLGKAKSTYFEAYLHHADSMTRLHATFKLWQTVTGRLSCANPNLQQIPREGNVKQSFSPEKGYELWELDYSNIEYRLAAVYSGDQDLIARFEAGEDFHTMIAERLGITRQVAKTVNFLTIYGGGVRALKAALHCTEAEAKKIFATYWAGMKSLQDIMNSATNAAESNMRIKLWSGRYRHFEYTSECRKAFNSLVQGGAFEIVKSSMLELEKEGFDIRNQVHDSVWLMIKDPKTEVPRAQEIMSGWTKEAFGLTFTVDAKRLK